MKGKFITVSGLDGAGKTTLLDEMQEYLQAKGRKVIRVREPGSTPACERIRDILKGQCTPPTEPLTPMAELLLFYASRVQVVEEIIKPALERDEWVLADRFDLDTLAYQGYGLGLLDQVLSITELALGDFNPDLRLLVDVDLATMKKRAEGRGAMDHIERRGDDYFTRVRKGFLLCHELPTTRWKNVKLVNGAVDTEAVFTSVKFALQPLLEGVA